MEEGLTASLRRVFDVTVGWPRSLAVTVLLLVLAALPKPAHAWRDMPWGLATIWWDLPPLEGAFHSLSIDVQISSDLPEDTHLFIAPIGMGWLDDVPFYGGLQVGAALPQGGQGRIGIFSRWQERSRDAIRSAPDGVAESSGIEGDFISVRRPFAWHHGRYTVTLAVTEQDAAGRRWLTMTVSEHPGEQRRTIGALRFPSGTGKLRPSLASFIEVFGPAIRPEAIPKATVVFGGIAVDGHPVKPRRARVAYALDVPPCIEASTPASGTVSLKVGQVTRRQDGMTIAHDGYAYRTLVWGPSPIVP